MRQVDLSLMRTMISSAMQQFSPEVQSIRNKTFKPIIIRFIARLEKCEKNESYSYVSPKQIRNAYYEQYGYGLSLLTIKEISDKLVTEQKLEADVKNKKYKLTASSRNEYCVDLKEGDKLIKRVIANLFQNIDESEISLYSDGFIHALTLLFSENQDIALNLMQGVSTETFLKGKAISRVSTLVTDIHKNLNEENLKNGLIEFFSNTTDPDFSRVKWNFAQNLHAAKALGLDDSGKFLSAELFENATFYLDTNILIPALEETHKHNLTIAAISNACQKISAELRVAEITIREMEGWLDYQDRLVRRTIDRIPESTMPKIRSLFIEKYLDRLKNGAAVTEIEDLFAPFINCRQIIQDDLSMSIDNDIWFSNHENTPSIDQLSKQIAFRFKEKRGRDKFPAQAKHDALLLAYLTQKTKENNKKLFLISTDLSLTEGKWPNIEKTPVISLDGLLQWLAPLSSNNYETFSELFAQMIKEKLLPSEKIFDLEDFNIFSEIEINSKSLPSEDVEGCIGHLRKNGVNLNPRKAEDREVLFYEIRKYFSDPGREYKQKIDSINIRYAELEELFKTQSKAYEEKIRQQELEFNTTIAQREEKIHSISKKHDDLKGDFASFKRKLFSGLRFSVAVGVLLVLYVILIVLIANYGDGPNLFQKIINSWVVLAVASPVSIFLCTLIVGKTNLQSLFKWKNRRE